MIEVTLTFNNVAEMLAHFSGAAPAVTPPVIAHPPAAVTAEKQSAAIASTKKGTAAPKPAEPPIEAPAPAPTSVQLDKVIAESTVHAKPREYETSGLPAKVKDAAVKSRADTVALLKKHGGVDATGAVSARFLPPEAFDGFEADIDALLAA